MQISLKFKLGMAFAGGIAGLYLTLLGVGLPLAKYMDSRQEEYHATGIAGKSVTIYSNPSMDSKPVGTLNPLETSEVVDRKKHEESNEIEWWYKVSLNGKDGWVPQMSYIPAKGYDPNFVADPSLSDYVYIVSANGQGSEGFYLSLLQGFERTTSVDITSMEIATNELSKMGSKKAIAELQRICKTRNSTDVRKALESLGGSLTGCGR